MLLQMSKPILTPITLQPQTDAGTKRIITLVDILLLAITGNYNDDAQLTAIQKLDIYRLKQKLLAVAVDGNSTEIELSDAELEICRDRSGKGLAIDVYGQVADIIGVPKT